jgi:hypothetical protein
LCRAVCRLYAVTTRGCHHRRTGRAGQCWLSVVLRALTRVSLSHRDAAAAAPWPLAPLCATAACRGSCVAVVIVLRARPGSARRHVRVLAGRPVYCARLSLLPWCSSSVSHPVRVSSCCSSEATWPLTSLPSHAALFASPRWSAAVGGAASAIYYLCSAPLLSTQSSSPPRPRLLTTKLQFWSLSAMGL